MNGLALQEWAEPEQIAQIDAIWSQANLAAIARALRVEGLDCFLVGGVVRDLLLARPNKDVDLVVDCSPSVLLGLGEQLASKTRSTPVVLDEVRGTLRLCFSGGDEFDLVALQGVSLLDDLGNRDLRINAIAVNSEGRLFDPLDGLGDLRKGVLRMVFPGSFKEDAVRVLRCLRFAAQLGFSIEQETLTALRVGAPGLNEVAGERITAELEKFFSRAKPEHIHELINVGLGAGSFPPAPGSRALLERAALEAPLTLAQGLALLFGPILTESPRRKELFERLRLSRQDRRYLEAWWNGARFCQEQTESSLASIFECSRVAGLAFGHLAQVLQYPEFPSALPLESRHCYLREASGRGDINWEPIPWSGLVIAEICGRSPGAWLGKVMRSVESAWACGDLKEDTDLSPFLEMQVETS